MPEMSGVADPIIETTHGKVRGKLRTTIYNDQYYCFDGIPYAKPPIGQLRFKAPQELEKWNDIRDCTEMAPKCLQYNRYTDKVEGSEDCLYLNVYTKKLQSDAPLPVMVYIHGGGFTTGDASRRARAPDYFMMKDVILITIGYRLGALGFLSLHDYKMEVPGNAGLKDIVQALQWIKNNCAKFNGDSENITLFGHSSGSSAVQLLMQCSQTKGLFHKAILMAGFAVKLRQVPNGALRFAKHIGYKGMESNPQSVYDFLMSVESEKLADQNLWTQDEIDRGNFYTFGPCQESYLTDETLIWKQPKESLKNAWGNEIPIMLGYTSFEGLIAYTKFTDPKWYEIYKKNPEYILPLDVQANCDGPTQRKFAQELVHLHFGDKALSVENFNCGLDLFSYSFLYHPLHRYLNWRLHYSKQPTYLYRFDFDSPFFNLYRVKHCGPDVRGVGHVDELSYVFFMPESTKLESNTAEFQTLQRMIDMLTTFASRSNPNTEWMKPIEWSSLEPFRQRKCFNISNELSFIEQPEEHKCLSWDRIYEEAGYCFMR